MPPKSGKQQRFAGMSLSPEGRATLRAEGKEPMPPDVAREYATGPVKPSKGSSSPKSKPSKSRDGMNWKSGRRKR